jgi:hypothetical protein
MLSPERSFFLWSQLYRIDIGKAWIGAGHRNALMPKIRVATWETVETASALTLSAFPDLLARPLSQQRTANFFLDSLGPLDRKNDALVTSILTPRAFS